MPAGTDGWPFLLRLSRLSDRWREIEFNAENTESTEKRFAAAP